jgi:hypothetical protein
MRQYIGISPMGPTVLRNIRKDDTGEPLVLLDENAIAKVRINFADWLEGSETIESASVTAESCTISTSTASPNIDLTVSDATSYTDGKITLEATSSTGEVYRGVIRVRRMSRYNDEQSRRDYA